MSNPLADFDPVTAGAEFLRRIPREFAREHGVLSLGTVDGHERLAVCVGSNPDAIHNVGVRLGRPVRAETGDPEDLHRCIDQAYERFRAADRDEAPGLAAPELTEAADDDLDGLLAQAEKDLLATDGKAPMVRLVDRLLFHAVQIGASDLHVQPLAETVAIRHRIDGVLDDGVTVPVGLCRSLVSRIKVMGRMDVAERLIPQDGRASVRIGERAIDLRISSIPTTYGERMVIRLLDTTNQLCDFSRLGMPADIAATFLDCARRSSGIVLVTGPTGSGKTTTLYATLRELDNRERNIMTIEDPIEYELDSLGLPISQSQVNEKKGVNFANGLRHILRQDPDVILVGEIRDAETARIAIQSSLTGHLVFSTLHTNDALSSITRLLDLGVEPFLVADSLNAIMAQRLVRRVCGQCGGQGRADDVVCPACLGKGYAGRVGVFELVVADADLRAAITRRAPLEELKAIAEAGGLRGLARQGGDLVAAGLTSRTEVERVIHG